MNDQCLQVLDHVAIVLILTDEYRLPTKFWIRWYYIGATMLLKCASIGTHNKIKGKEWASYISSAKSSQY